MNDREFHNRLRSAGIAALVAAAVVAPTTPAIAQDNAGPEVEVVTVTGQRLAQKRALERKRLSDAILDAVSSDEIGRLAAFAALPPEGAKRSWDDGGEPLLAQERFEPQIRAKTRP